MLNKVDTAGINPVSKVSPVLAVEPVASLIQSLNNNAEQFVKGQEYQAQVLSKLGDGTYTVKVKLHGACGSCPYSLMTLKNGVEQAIKRDVPQVKEVVAVNMP
jgi:hypothetical protein